ncbi:glycosyltransferase [Nostoc sp. MG11]|uniref:glycosyltransferase n=1 Tax=Nostoc sp. MG11 TaxID=2721166 RepID=UPI0018684B1D|nr:glycosyltransferase [Nostoc sp. MG11]
MKTFSSRSHPNKKIQINVVTAWYGGAHYATYHAIRAIVEQQKLPWELRVTDVDELVESLTKQQKIVDIYKLLSGVTGGELYNRMLKSGWTWLHPLILWLDKLLFKLNYDAGVEFFAEYWRQQQPDLVISLLPLYNKGLWDSLQKGKPDTPLVTVCVDLADSPPGFYIEPETGNYIVCATEKAVEQATSLGVQPERIIKTSGLIINPRFYEPISGERRTERERLGLDPDCLTGIVLFGGFGSKAMLEIAKRLECFQQKLQLIFICGRNEQLAVTLRESQGLQKRFVTSFTQDIPYYMHLADFFIGKPGGISISEALAMKLPMIVQRNAATLINERYNIEWIQQKKVGLVINSFRNVDQAVEKFLQPENFAQYRANVAAVNNQAVFEIPEIVQNILTTNAQTTATELLQQR